MVKTGGALEGILINPLLNPSLLKWGKNGLILQTQTQGHPSRNSWNFRKERPWLLLEGLRSLRLLLLVPADALNAQQRGLRPTAPRAAGCRGCGVALKGK